MELNDRIIDARKGQQPEVVVSSVFRNGVDGPRRASYEDKEESLFFFSYYFASSVGGRVDDAWTDCQRRGWKVPQKIAISSSIDRWHCFFRSRLIPSGPPFAEQSRQAYMMGLLVCRNENGRSQRMDPWRNKTRGSHGV
jgi:hypothetical protein